MNKILIENDNISFDKKIINAEFKSKDVTINIKNEVVLNIFESFNNIQNLYFNLDTHSSLKLNVYNSKADFNTNIIINLGNKSSFIGNLGFIATKKCLLNIKTTMNGNNIQNILKVRGISQEEGNFDIKVDGEVLAHTFDNEMTEDIKILNLNEKLNKVLPNMLVSSSEVKANHFVTISSLNEDELFYLKSKGLTLQKAKELMTKGFILSLYDNDFLNNLKEGR